jgi:hypothetical protein
MSFHNVCCIPVVDKNFVQGSALNNAKLWQVSSTPATQKQISQVIDLKERDIIPTIEPLRSVSQYNKAVHPYKAVERLLSAEIIDNLNSIEALENLRISSGDGGLWVKQINGESSDLGIALCLLMAAKNCKEQIIAATGALGDAQNSKDFHDSVVMPVADMAIKLNLIIELKQNGNTLDGLKKIFTPKQHIIENNNLELVTNLTEVEILKNLGVDVICIATLSEALPSLKIPIASTTLKNWFNYLAIAALLIAALLTGMKATYMQQAVNLNWQAPELGYPSRPFLVCAYDSIKRETHNQPIKDDKIVPINTKIGLFVQSNPDQGWQLWLYQLMQKWRGYQGLSYAMVLIGETSGINAPYIVMQPSKNDRFSNPGGIFAQYLQIGEQSENHLLMVLANRDGAIDIADLRTKIINRFKNEKTINFSEMEQFISQIVDGTIAYNFTSSEGSLCNEK